MIQIITKEALPNCNFATGIPSATMIFGRYDNNNDGKLTRGEFEEISEYFRGRLVLADENSDGAITKEELEAHLEQLQR